MLLSFALLAAAILPGFELYKAAVDGVEIAYQMRRGAGPAVVLIPGSYVGAEDWRDTVAALDRSFTVMIVEVRGHGDSWPPPENGSIPQFAADTFAAIDQAKIRRFFVGGHSLGGMIAIEMARQKPDRIRGVLSVEGWTHYSTLRDAFGDCGAAIPPQFRERLTELRKPVMTRWTKEQATRFGQIWRQWDGSAALRAARMPILELWGDRGVPPATRAQLKIPERANIELEWIAGASHFLPMERPKETAVAISRFVLRHARVERLLEDEDLLANPSALGAAKARHSMVFRGEEKVSGFNLHSYIGFYKGEFWAAWSSAKVHEEDPDQHIRYARSRDGHTWTKADVLAADPDGDAGPQRWIARGLFVENWRLRALGALVESAAYGQRGKGAVWGNLKLMAFTWDGRAWRPNGVYAGDCMNNFPPVKVAGWWTMPCRDRNMDFSLWRRPGLDDEWQKVAITNQPPFDRMDEPTIYEAADGTVHMIIRDGSRSRRLLRAVSTDDGATFPIPTLTNYPDATSKNYAGRLSNGWFYLISNPHPDRRDPLAISFSRDGWTYSKPMALRTNAAGKRYNSRPGSAASIQYPHAIEHKGSLWVVYSTNKEDIEVSEVRLKDLRLK
ncbi:MAG: alpha/beta fold hydrolase [Bryobacterales bacterium]|nr:alpha/beta fold hydrolase [Bryobacterales bacterium]